MEARISQTMEFCLYPVTLSYWANYFTAQWDIYCSSNPLSFEILNRDIPGHLPLFKSDIIDDYSRFRSFMQVLDLMVLDLYTFKYDKRHLVAAALYF